MIKVKTQIEGEERSITVQDTIRDDSGAAEALMSLAFGVWRAAMSAD